MSGIPSWAVRGAEVACIVTDWDGPHPLWLAPPPHRVPMLHEVLTISEVVPAENFERFGIRPAGGCALRFDTISSYWLWPASNFRPLVSTKTEAEDVALFHDIARQKLPEAV